MRNLKRVLTLVMAVAMLMSLMVVGAGAVTFPDQKDIKNVDAVNMNVALNIIKGRDDGNFDPTGNVTRGEMAKMICIAYAGGIEPTTGTQITPTYSDIKGHWAEKYIEYCHNLGVVAGMGDGTFQPNANVTTTQAAKMLLVAMGYNAERENFNGTQWAIAIGRLASDRGLYSGLNLDPMAALNRDNAAQMVANALEATMVNYKTELGMVDGKPETIFKSEDATIFVDGTQVPKTILNDKYKVKTAYGILSNVTYNKVTKKYDHKFIAPVSKPNNSSLELGSVTLSSETDFSALYGQQVKALYSEVNSKQTVFGMYAYKTQVMATGIVDDWGSSSKTGYIKFAGEHYKLDSSIAKPENIPATPFNQDRNLSTTLNGLAAYYNTSLIDNDGDGDVDYVTYMPFSVAKVTYVSSTNITAGSKSYTVADIKAFEGIKKNDYTKIIAAVNTVNDTVQLNAVDKMVEGKVTSATVKNTAADGTKYMLYTIGDAKYSTAGSLTLKVADSVKSAPCVNGFLFDADTTSTVVIEDYGVITKVGTFDGWNDNRAELLLADGTKKTVTTDKSYEVGNATTPTKGDLVTYKLNNDDDYVLTHAINENTSGKTAADAGFNAIATGAGAVNGGSYATDTITDSSNGVTTPTSTSKVKYINGWNIADDAVIFIHKDYGTGGYEVITGSKLKGMANRNLVLNVAYANKESSNSSYTVQMAYITTTEKLSDTGYKYGVVMNDLEVYTADGKQYYQVTIWDGTGDAVKTLRTEKYSTSYNIAKVVKGDVIQYTMKGDYIEQDPTIYKTTGSPNDAVAVTVYNDKDKTIQLYNDSKHYKITNDTLIINYDRSGSSYMLQNSKDISEANYNPVTNLPIANSIVCVDSTGDVLMIAQEVDNEMVGNAAFVGSDITAANVNDALKNYDSVTIGSASTPANATLTGITVPSDKTLNVIGNLTLTTATTNTINGSLVVTGNLTLNENYTVQQGKVLAVTGNLVGAHKLVVNEDASVQLEGTIASNPIEVNKGADLTVTNSSASITSLKNVGGTVDTKAAITTVTENSGTITTTAAITTVTKNTGTINTTAGITTLTANDAEGVVNVSGAAAGTLNLGTVTTNAGTINVNRDVTIGTLTTNTGKIAVAKDMTLTISNATATSNLYTMTGVAGAKLVLGADTTGNYNSILAAGMKFYDNAKTECVSTSVLPDATYLCDTITGTTLGWVDQTTTL